MTLWKSVLVRGWAVGGLQAKHAEITKRFLSQFCYESNGMGLIYWLIKSHYCGSMELFFFLVQCTNLISNGNFISFCNNQNKHALCCHTTGRVFFKLLSRIRLLRVWSCKLADPFILLKLKGDHVGEGFQRISGCLCHFDVCQSIK